MNIQERILSLNQEYTHEIVDIKDLLLTIITESQIFEPCCYLSEDDEWLNVIMLFLEDTEVSQVLSIKKSEIAAFGVFNKEEIELDFILQKGSEDLYQ